MKLSKWILNLVLFLMFISCSSRESFDAGHPITPEELASISEAVFATEKPDPADTAEPIETLPDADTYPIGTVHWTESGSVYHTEPNCYHLKRADIVYHGGREAASKSGKARICSSCAKHMDDKN